METFCLAIAFSTSLYMSVLCIPSPQNIVKAYTHEMQPNELVFIYLFVVFFGAHLEQLFIVVIERRGIQFIDYARDTCKLDSHY